MRQLALFPGAVPEPEPATEPEPEPEPELDEPEEPTPPAADDVLPGQIALFGDRAVRFGRARAAIAEARLEDARRDLAALKKRFPDDPGLAREAARTAKLARAYKAALGSPPEGVPAALLGFARGMGAADEEPWASLRRAVLRRVAGALGETARLQGEPAGFYLLEAGAFDEAAASLARAASRAPSAHLLLLLGDATLLAGARPEARRRYLEALVLDPFDRALATLRDEDVRALPDVARDDIEIEDEPAAWSAPVGVITGVLPSPASLAREALEPEEPPAPAGRTAGEQRALTAARAFVRALADAASPAGHGAGAVEVRRTMKRLSPRLFAAYMERVVRGRR